MVVKKEFRKIKFLQLILKFLRISLITDKKYSFVSFSRNIFYILRKFSHLQNLSYNIRNFCMHFLIFFFLILWNSLKIFFLYYEKMSLFSKTKVFRKIYLRNCEIFALKKLINEKKCFKNLTTFFMFRKLFALVKI